MVVIAASPREADLHSPGAVTWCTEEIPQLAPKLSLHPRLGKGSTSLSDVLCY